jgi:hypothetical protein
MADNNLRQELNEKSLDIMADMLDPYFELMKDPEFTKLFMTNVMEAIKYACKHHKKETIQIAAILSEKTEDEFVVNPFATPMVLLSAIGMYSEAGQNLFISQVQNTEEASSGSAMENTEASEQSENS